jgi:hypothetical protein
VRDAPLLQDLASTAGSVALAVLPLAVLFLLFQVFFLNLPRREVARVLTGTLVASAGLYLFLLGVSIGFLPFGRAIGETLASRTNIWMLVALGVVLGFVTTWGEPAVRILADQVEEATSGSIRESVVLTAVCIGVAAAVGVGMFRIANATPLLWLLVPGYLVVLIGIRVTDPEFVAIAIDAGGVATGPLANTFLLALAIGAASVIPSRDPLVYGFGLVSLIALAPLISVMLLGLLVRLRTRRKES